MMNLKKTRRDFLLKAMTTAAALPLVASCRSDAAAQQLASNDIMTLLKRNAIQDTNGEWNGAIDAPDKIGPKFDLADASHKGDLIKISGTVYRPDGKTPAPNTLIYLYHTDTEGHYGRSANEHRHGKYRGWMLTNHNGSYAFVTIKPAPYPERKFAAHIHMTVTTETKREDWIDSILFEDDPLISARERSDAGKRGGFNPIVTLEKGDGGLYYAARDIQLMS